MPSLSEYKNQPGVEDLPPKARQAFAGALKMEEQGKHDKAEVWLNKAIRYEEQGK